MDERERNSHQMNSIEFEILVEGDLLSFDKCIDFSLNVSVAQEHMFDS